MIKFIKDMFSAGSSVSAMRVMAMLCCLSAIVIAIVGVCKKEPDYEGLSILSATFLTTAFGGKVAQKHLESKSISKV